MNQERERIERENGGEQNEEKMHKNKIGKDGSSAVGSMGIRWSVDCFRHQF